MCEWKRKREREKVRLCVCLYRVFVVGRTKRGVRWKEGNHQTRQLTLFPSKIFSNILPSTTSILQRMNILPQKKQEKQSQFLKIWIHHSNHIFHVFIFLLWASESCHKPASVRNWPENRVQIELNEKVSTSSNQGRVISSGGKPVTTVHFSVEGQLEPGWEARRGV